MKKTIYLLCLFGLFCLIFSVSCNKSKIKPPYPILMTANVNGTSWSTTNVTARYDVLGTDIILVIIGQTDSSGQNVALHVENFEYGRGLINLEAKPEPSPYPTADASYSPNFSAFNIATSGQLNITNVTNQVIQGTFEFKGPGTTVTGGSFTVATPQ